jgi:hypothetical protein
MSDGDVRYGEFLRRIGTGEPMSEELWLHHFEHQNAGARSGIPVGASAPELGLSDQDGRVRHLDDLRGHEGLLLVFVRSADW